MKKLFCVLALLALLIALPTYADSGKAYDSYWSQDYETALRDLLPLAQRGDPVSQLILGWMYEKGLGVPQDFVLSHMWGNLAAAKCKEHGAFTRDRVAKRMTLEQIGEAQRMAREWKPSK